MGAWLGQIGIPRAEQAARIASDSAIEGNRAWVIAGGILLLVVIAAAWWHAKHG